MTTPLVWSSLGALFAALAIALAAHALRRRRKLAALAALVPALALALASVALGAFALGAHGYRALTREVLAATVEIEPGAARGHFEATFLLPDGSRERHALRGDQLRVEARVLKWHPWLNLLGLHTAYELDRVSGRWARTGDARRAPASVAALGSERRPDLFAWSARAPWLAPLLDASYGSGTFAPANRRAVYEIRVSTSGLLIREAPRAGGLGSAPGS